MDPPVAEDNLDFDSYANSLTLRHARVLATVVAIAAIVTWPLDWVLFAGREQVLLGLAVSRTFGSASATVGATVMYVFQKRIRNSFPVVATTMVACSIATSTGYTLAGGLDLATFQSVPFAALTTVPMIWSLRTRTITTLLVVIVFFATFWVVGSYSLDEGYLAHPWLGPAMANAGLGVLTSVVIGEMTTRLIRSDFWSSRALRQRAEVLSKKESELLTLNTELEALVAARTDELARLAAHLEVGREEERRRIARELHDETGQLLTALRMELAFASKRARGNLDLEESLARLDNMLEQTLTSTRELVQRLRPRILDDYGLSGGAEWMLERFVKSSRLDVDWQIDLGGDEITAEQATATFRILQEALTNVARHAKARKTTVRLSADEETVVLEVSDDGVGVTPNHVQNGFGVLGMQERARALGGTVSVAATQGSGTLVSMRLPRSRS